MEQIPILPSVILLIAAAVLVVVTFKSLKLSPVLGYLVAGTLIGDYGLKIVSHSQTAALGELGIVFLLFAIGLELSFERLKAMRRYVLGLGSMQVILTTVVILFLVLFCTEEKYKEAILIGGGLALSSTAIVLQVIAENKSQATQVGRVSLAILLMQDFSVVPLLVMVPILAGSSDSSIGYLLGEAIIKAIFALLIIFISGRLLLRPLFRLISSDGLQSPSELFIAATLLIVLTAAWCTEHMGLSLALGAFVAGILVAETEFRLKAEESIAPFKGLLLGLFFMSVGMGIDVKEIYENIWTILLLSLALITVKSIIITLLCLLFGFNKGTAIHTGLLLSQGGEFAFILFNLGIESKLIAPASGEILLIIVTCTMALTPLLAAIGQKIASLFDDTSQHLLSNLQIVEKGSADLNHHIILAGFGEVGKMVARMLNAETINYIILDINPDKVAAGKAEGYPIFQGDISHKDTLDAAGFARAQIVMIAIGNIITVKKSVKVIANNFKDVSIIVQAKDYTYLDDLYKAGATQVVPEVYEFGLQLGTEVLRTLGINNYEIDRIKTQFRAGNYLAAHKDQRGMEYEDNED